MEEFIKNLQFIFRPNFWVMNYEFSKEWDDKLNELLDKYQFTNIDLCTASLGNANIWIANYPYGCFGLQHMLSKRPSRPSRLTILRAEKILKQSGGRVKIFNYERELLNSLK
jgi:hypothetical protein